MYVILQYMLDRSFVDFGATIPLGDVMTKAPLRGADGLAVGFRGDQRALVTIRRQGGSKAKSDVAPMRSTLGLDEDWNPLSSPANADKRWYRALGNRDNDLYTVVSVAQDWVDATKFPLVEEPRTKKRRHPSGFWQSSCTLYVVAVKEGSPTPAGSRATPLTAAASSRCPAWTSTTTCSAWQSTACTTERTATTATGPG